MSATKGSVIKAEDIRIGNWLEYQYQHRFGYDFSGKKKEGEWYAVEVDLIDYDEINTAYYCDGEKSDYIPYGYLRGIELTPELLEAAGFKTTGGPIWNKVYNDIGNCFTINVMDGEYWTNFGDCKLDSLHKLQNAYWLYTGHELQINLPTTLTNG